MANWNGLTTSTHYTTVVTNINDRLKSSATMDYSNDSNVPVGSIRYDNNKLQRYNGNNWQDVIAASVFDHDSLFNYDDNKHPNRAGNENISGEWSFLSSPKLANNVALKGRNSANNSDLDLLIVDSSDNTIIKSSSAKPVIIAPEGAESVRFETNKVKSNGLLDIETNTPDGSDNSSIAISGGGARGSHRGGYVAVYGNEHASNAGGVVIESGNITGKGVSYKAPNALGVHEFFVNGSRKLRIDPNHYYLDSLTPSRPLSLDSSKRISTPTASSFRTSNSIAKSGINTDITAINGVKHATWSPVTGAHGSGAMVVTSANNFWEKYQRVGEFLFFQLTVDMVLTGSPGQTIILASPPILGQPHHANCAFVARGQNGGVSAELRWRLVGGSFHVFKEGAENFALGHTVIQIDSFYKIA